MPEYGGEFLGGGPVGGAPVDVAGQPRRGGRRVGRAWPGDAALVGDVDAPPEQVVEDLVAVFGDGRADGQPSFGGAGDALAARRGAAEDVLQVGVPPG